MTKAYRYAQRVRDGQVFERTPDSGWLEANERWRSCRQKIACSYHNSVVPVPMPWGHTIFEGGYGDEYRLSDELPRPVWTDGAGAVYLMQRVGWRTQFRSWMYGQVYGVECALAESDSDVLLKVRFSSGYVCAISPMQLA